MHIVDMTYFWARTMPQRPAIIEPEGIITYAALAQATEAAAEHFARNIPDRSKPIAVSLSTASKMLVASLGLLRAGFSIVPVTKSLFEHLPSTGANTLVYERDGATLDGATNIAFDDIWISSGTTAAQQNKPIPAVMSGELEVFFYTSGTTGRPKQFVKARKAWDERMLFPSISTFVNFERVLIVSGLSSSFGFTRAYEALFLGKTACFAVNDNLVLWLVNTYNIDLIVASTQQAIGLAELQEKVARFPLASLKAVNIGGGAITREGILRLKRHLCHNIIIRYGSTEAGTVALAPYDMIADVPGAVGFVAPEVELEIVDEAGHVLPYGSEGFVRLRTPQFVKNLPSDESAGAWFYPGDIGWLTENRVLCIAGRTGDVLNRGGVKLSITDFETFLLSCPGVKDAGVCTVMASTGFEEVWIGVVLEPSVDMAVFQQSIESNADFRTSIDKLFVVETVPRGTLGKVQRDELKKMLLAISDEPALSGGATRPGATT